MLGKPATARDANSKKRRQRKRWLSLPSSTSNKRVVSTWKWHKQQEIHRQQQGQQQLRHHQQQGGQQSNNNISSTHILYCNFYKIFFTAVCEGFSEYEMSRTFLFWLLNSVQGLLLEIIGTVITWREDSEYSSFPNLTEGIPACLMEKSLLVKK